MSRALATLALLAALVTACTIQIDLPGGDDDDGDDPRSGLFPCPGCTDAGPGDDVVYPDGGTPWWDSDGGPHDCGDSDAGPYGYGDAGYDYTPDAGADW